MTYFIERQSSTSLSLALHQPPSKKPANDYDDLFDEDDDDRVMDEGLSDTKSPLKKHAAAEADEYDDDDFMPLTGRVKNRGAILDDDNSLGERLRPRDLERFKSMKSSSRLRVFAQIQDP